MIYAINVEVLFSCYFEVIYLDLCLLQVFKVIGVHRYNIEVLWFYHESIQNYSY